MARFSPSFLGFVLTLGLLQAPAALQAQSRQVPARKPAASRPAPRPAANLAAKPAPAGPQKRANYVVGRVTNEAGQPLANATVAIYGTTTAGANTRFEAVTDAQGQYAQRVPEGIYGATAYYETRYHDLPYKFTLPPTDGSTAKQHDSAEGIRKDFVWHIAGLKPREQPGTEGAYSEPNKYFGASVSVSTKAEGFGGERVYLPAGATLELTLTPRGPLLDGSAGQPVVFRRRFDKDVTSSIPYWYLTNIPVGRYALQAVLVAPDGSRRPLPARVVSQGAEFSATPVLDFKPTQFGDLQQEQVTLAP